MRVSHQSTQGLVVQRRIATCRYHTLSSYNFECCTNYCYQLFFKNLCILTNFCWPKIFLNLTCFRFYLLEDWVNAWRCVHSIIHFDVRILVKQLYVIYLNHLMEFIIHHELLNNHQYVTSRCFRHRLGCYRLVSEPWL